MDIVASIASLVTLAVKAAPVAEDVYNNAKSLITALFEKGAITADQQNQLMSWCDAHQAATLAGQEPPEFVVS